MEETRVSRYKEYRQSFTREGAIPLETPETGETSLDISATTSTLPMEEVIKGVQEEEMKYDTSERIRRRHILKLVLEISIAVLVVAGLVVLGIFAWRTK